MFVTRRPVSFSRVFGRTSQVKRTIHCNPCARGSRLFQEAKPPEAETSKTEPETSKPIPRGPVSWLSVAITLGVGGVAAAVYAFMMQEKERKFQAEMNKTTGKARVGGPFFLVDHNGKLRSDNDFRGKFMLIYFGFTHCPDICPTELKKMGSVLNTLAKTEAAGLIQPLFITIDPLRDSVEQTREYLKDFHPSIIGLTGTPAQIDQICKAFRVYHSKAWDNAGEKAEDDYLVDHSIILYLMDPNGDFVDFFGTNMSEQQVVERMSEHIGKHLHPAGRPWWQRLLG